MSFPEMRKGEVAVSIATVLARKLVQGFPPLQSYSSQEAAYAVGIAQRTYYRQLEEQNWLRMIRSRDALIDHLKEWKQDPVGCPLAIILGMEGAEAISSPEQVSHWFDLGLRVLGPVHYGTNRYAHGTGSSGGFTEEGKRLLKQMEQSGIILDLTHLSDPSFWEALQRYEGPVLASHHNCRALVPGERQLSDDQIRAVIERNGVLGVALDAWMLQPGWKKGVSDPSQLSLTAVVDQIEHICAIAGNSDHVGIGSDLDGGFGTEQCPGDLDKISDLQKLPELMDKRGFQSAAIEAVMHGNWVRFFESNLEFAV